METNPRATTGMRTARNQEKKAKEWEWKYEQRKNMGAGVMGRDAGGERDKRATECDFYDKRRKKMRWGTK